MEIRPLNHQDTQAVQSLRANAKGSETLGDQKERERGLTQEQIELHLQDPFITFGAFKNHSLVGIASVSRMPDCPFSADKLIWYALSGVLVADGGRGHGIGRSLVERCLSYAIENGANGILLEVNIPNAAAMSLYESMGFEPWNVLENSYTHQGISFSQVSMRKMLEPLSNAGAKHLSPA